MTMLTYENIFDLAEAAGVQWLYGEECKLSRDQLIDLALSIEAATREQCARIADECYGWRGDTGEYTDDLGEAIRGA